MSSRAQSWYRPAGGGARSLTIGATIEQTIGPAEPGTRPRSASGQRRPLVIGHRGAPGYRPEHTLASYALAARMGADAIEPDLVATKDHVLVARHENEISATTDVASRREFARRRATKVVDGSEVTGWFTEDFTLAELRSLRAVERLPGIRPENQRYDGRFLVPTFSEILTLRARLQVELGRPVAVYPETKHPTYFRGSGLDLDEPLVAALRAQGLDRPDAPVFVQSFELGNLVRMRDQLGFSGRLVFLTSPGGGPYDLRSAGEPRSYADLTTPGGLRELARTVDGIGPHKAQVIPCGDDGRLGEPTALVRDAHDAGLVVHPYTFRAENTFLPPTLRHGSDATSHGHAVQEQLAFLQAGVDGLFADQPDLAVQARAKLLRAQRAA